MKYILQRKSDEQKGIVISEEILEKFNIKNNCQYEVDGDQNFLILKIVRDNEKSNAKVNSQLEAVKELNGLLADESISKEKAQEFEALLADRVNFSKGNLEL